MFDTVDQLSVKTGHIVPDYIGHFMPASYLMPLLFRQYNPARQTELAFIGQKIILLCIKSLVPDLH